MFKDMDKETLQGYIKSARNRYAGLGLSDAQAVKMLELEDDTEGRQFDFGKGAEIFSLWERQDYELDEARGFLHADQLALYAKRQRAAAEKHEATLSEHDAKQAKEAALNEEYNGWLREQFLPAVLRESIRVPIVFLMEKEKIAYLRAEHQQFLALSRRNALVRHYRYSRGFEPNKLKMSLNYYERQALLPDFESFLSQADEAVRSVGNFLVEKYRNYAEHGAEFFKQKSAESKKQYAGMRMRHIGEQEISGWHTTIVPKTALTEAQGWLMAVMLMDNGGSVGGLRSP
jgi:hypothetical protein